ncbi:MAG: hypothetical protein N7Q72_01085, partial [Spiroplasma sp. Tabriz.8]|nr:hypothetical protein [Spiroplasma sp. Tabriz.8]
SISCVNNFSMWDNPKTQHFFLLNEWTLRHNFSFISLSFWAYIYIYIYIYIWIRSPCGGESKSIKT